jgi:hypothetical protein
MIAHYYATRNVKTLYISSGHDNRAPGFTRIAIQVSGKREARRIAAEHGATCWNF